MAKYIATAVGFDNVALRNPGDVFEAPADFPKGDWFKPYKGKDKEPAAQSEQQQSDKPADSAA